MKRKSNERTVEEMCREWSFIMSSLCNYSSIEEYERIKEQQIYLYNALFGREYDQKYLKK